MLAQKGLFLSFRSEAPFPREGWRIFVFLVLIVLNVLWGLAVQEFRAQKFSLGIFTPTYCSKFLIVCLIFFRQVREPAVFFFQKSIFSNK